MQMWRPTGKPLYKWVLIDGKRAKTEHAFERKALAMECPFLLSHHASHMSMMLQVSAISAEEGNAMIHRHSRRFNSLLVSFTCRRHRDRDGSSGRPPTAKATETNA